MQSGSVNNGPKVNPQLKKPANGKNTSEEVAKTGVEQQTHETPPSQDTTTLAARFRVPTESLGITEKEDGNHKSNMTIVLAPEEKRAMLEEMGVVYAELEEVRSNAGLDVDGRLELVSVEGTGKDDTTNIVETFEVKKSDLEVNPETGKAPIEDYTAVLLSQGEGILPKEHFAVPEGTQVAPKGYAFDLATSEEGAKTEKGKMRLAKFGDVASTFGQSGLIGLMPIPGSNLLAFGGSLLADSSKADQLKKAQDTLSYVQSREKTSETDKIELEVGVGFKVPVSAEAEKGRLETQVRAAKSKLWSNRLTAVAGGTSVLGIMAGAGTFGSGAGAALLGAAATASAPYLAGAAMVVGTGGTVFDSVDKLRKLSKEKAELEARMEKGETHIDRVVEQVDPDLKRHVATNEVKMPINERLKEIGKEQNKHRLLATALTGGMGSIGATVVMGGGLSMAPLALAPAGLVAGGQSVMKLRELSGEKKELVEKQKAGETMTTRDVKALDGSWSKEKVPISNLLSDIKKEQNKHKLILTSVGTVGAAMGMTLGAGMAVTAAAPLVLVPALVGAALFPDKAKEFAGKVAKFFTGFASEESRTRKSLMKMTNKRADEAESNIGAMLGPLAKSNPELFSVADRPGLVGRMRGKETEGSDGYFTILNGLMGEFRNAGSRQARAQAMNKINSKLAQAPPAAQKLIPDLKKQFDELYMDTEAAWVARDISLEMQTPTTEKVVSDGRVGARLDELGFDTKDVRAQYKESLELETNEAQFQLTDARHKAGDKYATRLRARSEVFASARVVHTARKELGDQLFTKVVDAVHRPDDEENLELVSKEVAYKMRDQGGLLGGPDRDAYLSPENIAATQEQMSNLAHAVSVLESPLTVAPDTQAELDHSVKLLQQQMGAMDKEKTAQLIRTEERLHKDDGKFEKGLNDRLAEMVESFPDPLMARFYLDAKARARKGPEQAAGTVTQDSLNQARDKALAPLLNIDEEAARKMVELDAKMSGKVEAANAQEALAERRKMLAQHSALRRQFQRTNPEALKAFEIANEKAKAGPPEVKPAEQAVPKEPLRGAEARMANAFRGLRQVDSKTADELNAAFAALDDPQTFEGMSQEDATKKKFELSKQEVQAKNKLRKKAPEMLALWETARKDVEEEHFERAINRDFVNNVLKQPSVTEAAERLEMDIKDVEGLYIGFLRSEVLGKNEEFQSLMADESGEKVDARKQEILDVLSTASVKATGEMTGGGADMVEPAADKAKVESSQSADAGAAQQADSPLNDPKVVAFLQNNPVVEQVLTSGHLVELAKKLQVSPEQAQTEFLTLYQIEQDPVRTAEFQGRIQGGDLKAVQTLEVGKAVGGLVNQLTRPDPELVKQQVEAGMNGPVVATVLGDEQIQAMAEQLNLDSTAVMRKLLTADLSGDASYVASLQQKAQKGDTAARAEFQFAQVLSQATLQVGQQMAAQQQQAGQVPGGPQAA